VVEIHSRSRILGDYLRGGTTEEISGGAVEGQEAFVQLEHTVRRAQQHSCRRSPDDHAQALDPAPSVQELEEFRGLRGRERRLDLGDDEKLRRAPQATRHDETGPIQHAEIRTEIPRAPLEAHPSERPQRPAALPIAGEAQEPAQSAESGAAGEFVLNGRATTENRR